MTKDDFLSHHGILGMKWGVRRYQNEDGTLTDEGKARYAQVSASDWLKSRERRKAIKTVAKSRKQADRAAGSYQRIAKKARRKGKLEEAETLEKLAEAKKLISKSLDKKLSDISDGKVQAGKDYIVSTEYYLKPIDIFLISNEIPMYRKERYLVERNPE